MPTHPSHHGRGIRGLRERDGRTAEARRGRREAEAERRRGSRPPPSGTGVTTRATGFGGATSAFEDPAPSRLTFVHAGGVRLPNRSVRIPPPRPKVAVPR